MTIDPIRFPITSRPILALPVKPKALEQKVYDADSTLVCSTPNALNYSLEEIYKKSLSLKPVSNTELANLWHSLPNAKTLIDNQKNTLSFKTKEFFASIKSTEKYSQSKHNILNKISSRLISGKDYKTDPALFSVVLDSEIFQYTIESAIKHPFPARCFHNLCFSGLQNNPEIYLAFARHLAELPSKSVQDFFKTPGVDPCHRSRLLGHLDKLELRPNIRQVLNNLYELREARFQVLADEYNQMLKQAGVSPEHAIGPQGSIPMAQKGFRQASLKLHPDRVSDDLKEDATKQFQRFTEIAGIFGIINS